MENKLELVQEAPQEEQTVTVLDVIDDSIRRLDTLTYNNEEVVKFGITISTVRKNLFTAFVAMCEADRKAAAEAEQAKQEAPADEPKDDLAEAIAEVKRYEEGVQDGNAEAK